VPALIEEIVAAFQDVLNPKVALQRTTDNVAYHLQTRGQPIASKFRRLDAAKLTAAKEFRAMEQAGHHLST
jgi:predicted Ser/Thr protein kinase